MANCPFKAFLNGLECILAWLCWLASPASPEFLFLGGALGAAHPRARVWLLPRRFACLNAHPAPRYRVPFGAGEPDCLSLLSPPDETGSSVHPAVLATLRKLQDGYFGGAR